MSSPTPTSTTLPADDRARLRRHERRRGVARDRARPLARPARLQLLGRRHALAGARRRQGPAGAAAGAVLRAGADQEARRRVGRDRHAAARGVGVARLRRACRRRARRRGCGSSRRRGATRCSRPTRRCSTDASPRRKAGCWRCDRRARSGVARARRAPVDADMRGRTADTSGGSMTSSPTAVGRAGPPARRPRRLDEPFPPRRDPGAARDRRGARRACARTRSAPTPTASAR